MHTLLCFNIKICKPFELLVVDVGSIWKKCSWDCTV